MMPEATAHQEKLGDCLENLWLSKGGNEPEHLQTAAIGAKALWVRAVLRNHGNEL